MRRPNLLGVMASIVIAGFCNALIYTFGFLVLLLYNFVTKPGGDIGVILTAVLTTLVFTGIVYTFITVIIAVPIALVFWAFGFTRRWAFLVAPAIGVVPVALIASNTFALSHTNYLMIIGFAFSSSAVMWLLFGRRSANAGSSAPLQQPVAAAI